MKNLFYFLMWAQFVITIFYSVFHPEWGFDVLWPSAAVSADITSQWIFIVALYVAWRVTPESKPQKD